MPSNDFCRILARPCSYFQVLMPSSWGSSSCGWAYLLFYLSRRAFSRMSSSFCLLSYSSICSWVLYFFLCMEQSGTRLPSSSFFRMLPNLLLRQSSYSLELLLFLSRDLCYELFEDEDEDDELDLFLFFLPPALSGEELKSVDLLSFLCFFLLFLSFLDFFSFFSLRQPFRQSSSTSWMIFFISMGLFMTASLAFISSRWMAQRGSSCSSTKSSHFRLVASSWNMCLTYFLLAFLAPVRNSSLFFCCWSLLPQSYIQSIRSRWDFGISPASTWIRFISSLYCSSRSFLALSFCLLMTSS